MGGDGREGNGRDEETMAMLPWHRVKEDDEEIKGVFFSFSTFE